MSSESLLSATVSPSGARNQTDIYAVHGADPEVLAYAMAKYSRSSLSMRESLTEISAQRAEQFLNTFYFQYGHRSIADLAHIAFAVERLSLLAAIVLVDEQRWDGQERSTRYQNFQKSGWYFPEFVSDAASAKLYSDTVENLFAAYQRTTAAVHAALRDRVVCPETMKPEAYDRTLKARAFDVARYLLPLATNTSLGQIVNARTLETQVSRLLSHPIAEVRELGAKLRDAATGPAWNVNARAAAAFVEKLGDSELSAEAANLLTREVRTAPTLVKYAEPNQYLIETRAELEQASKELLKGIAPAASPVVDLVERTESLEVELAATLIYWASEHPYRQVRDIVAGLGSSRVSEIIELGLKHRGRHDEALRVFHAGAALRFDILMDIGGFRDMHRHRRVTQIKQEFTAVHGFDTPHSGDAAGLEEAGVLADYQAAIESAHAASAKIAAGSAPEAASSALYVLPLATRVRCLFKMDFAEAQYISELRSAPAGHFSYRRVAWEMYLALERQHPTLAKYVRATDFSKPIDLLQR
ncbi:FAD-dependent thymidylate synthase [Telmatobacter sp. DSM 110680]|uniref:FAD-dependent thymidylate synthase n=1 Tax=Telmatobacter sp. DSM 110680 TaxID=3036704 RepID=A0AAU7DPE9_9BACT